MQGFIGFPLVQIQAVHLGFPEEYLEENLEDAFSCIGILGTISFRRILPGWVFQLIQPWSIQQVVFPQSVIYGCKIVFFSQPIKSHGSTTIPRPDGVLLFLFCMDFMEQQKSGFEQPVPRALRPAGQKRPGGAFLGRGLANPFWRAKKRIAMYFCNALFGLMLFGFQNHFPLSGKMILLTKKKITIDTPPFKTVVPML